MMKVYFGHYFKKKWKHYSLLSTESGITWRMGRSYIEFGNKSVSSCLTNSYANGGIKTINIPEN